LNRQQLRKAVKKVYRKIKFITGFFDADGTTILERFQIFFLKTSIKAVVKSNPVGKGLRANFRVP